MQTSFVKALNTNMGNMLNIIGLSGDKCNLIYGNYISKFKNKIRLKLHKENGDILPNASPLQSLTHQT